MSKLNDAKLILIAFNLPVKQQNDRSARVLLALSNIKKNSSWKKASNTPIRIHDILGFISKYHDFQYAENSRETIRRQSIHQFEQAGIVVRNIDDPSRPTNSGFTVYSLTDEALTVIQKFKSPDWDKSIQYFNDNVESTIEKYRKIREFKLIPIIINGKQFTLSPGGHNQLQKEIIENFASRFAPGSKLIYLGDTANKHLHLDKDLCNKISIDITHHDKLPDVVLYLEKKNWLLLIEAVTSHGPVSKKRFIEISEMLEKCSSQKIFVSTFPDFKTFLKYVSEIAWETEVWIAENPDHMIHFNGDKFFPQGG